MLDVIGVCRPGAFTPSEQAKMHGLFGTVLPYPGCNNLAFHSNYIRYPKSCLIGQEEAPFAFLGRVICCEPGIGIVQRPQTRRVRRASCQTLSTPVDVFLPARR